MSALIIYFLMAKNIITAQPSYPGRPVLFFLLLITNTKGDMVMVPIPPLWFCLINFSCYSIISIPYCSSSPPRSSLLVT